MKASTKELTSAALDWAVAKCEESITHYQDYRLVDGELYSMFCDVWLSSPYSPSTNWARGGPIIERENMTISHSPYDHVFYGRTRPWCAEKKGRMEYGSTPLIAAMRCYVASKLGDNIDIPEELK